MTDSAAATAPDETCPYCHVGLRRRAARAGNAAFECPNGCGDFYDYRQLPLVVVAPLVDRRESSPLDPLINPVA
jgi:hypothetical protein